MLYRVDTAVGRVKIPGDISIRDCSKGVHQRIIQRVRVESLESVH